MSEGRATIVVTTYNRRVHLLGALQSLQQMPGQWPIIVVDNGSTDGSADAVTSRFPGVMLIRMRQHLGVAARNIGAAYVHTPYVVFCDDEVQWEPGALERATDIMDAAPTVAVLSPCVQLGLMRDVHPACAIMAESPLARGSLPGPRLLNFFGEACVMRARAFRDVGGYWPPLFIGEEEALMALDLAERGWRILYAQDVVAQHFPVSRYSNALLVRLTLRNAIWIAWMRRAPSALWRITLARLAEAKSRGMLWLTLAAVIEGLPRVLRRRHAISAELEQMCALVERVGGESAFCHSHLDPSGPTALGR